MSPEARYHELVTLLWLMNHNEGNEIEPIREKYAALRAPVEAELNALAEGFRVTVTRILTHTGGLPKTDGLELELTSEGVRAHIKSLDLALNRIRTERIIPWGVIDEYEEYLNSPVCPRKDKQ